MQCNFLHPRNTVLNSEPGRSESTNTLSSSQNHIDFVKTVRQQQEHQTVADHRTVGPVAARIPKNQRSKRTCALINFQYHTRAFVERPWSQAEYSIRADSPELTLLY